MTTTSHGATDQPQQSATRTEAGLRPTNGSLATAILIYLGLSLQLLQVGIIALLPKIGMDIGTDPATTSWLVTGGLLSGAVLLAVFSRLADLIGKKPVVLVALGLVLLGSIIGCFADNFAGLLVARILMGAVLPMLALPEAIASDTMEPRRAHFAIGAIHTGTGAGISAGLILGALAAAGTASWRSFFVVSAIASAVALIAVVFGVKDSEARAPGRLNIVGAVLLSAGLVGVLLAVSEGPTWGWSSFRTLFSAAAGVLVLVIWWVQEHKVTQPLISLKHLLEPAIRLPYAITFLASIGIYSALSAVTRLAQTPSITGAGYGWTGTEVAWYAVPQFLGALVGLAIIHTLVGRGQRVAALMTGLALLLISFAVYAPLVGHAGATLSALLLDSAGLATTLAVCQIIILRRVPAAESGVAVGLSIVLYAIGNSLGNAITASLFSSDKLTSGLPALGAYRWSFVVSGLAIVAALALCARLRSVPDPTG